MNTIQLIDRKGKVRIGKKVVVSTIFDIDEQTHKIQSREYNRLVPVWNHLIKIQSSKDGKVNYTDEIHLYAGCLTKFVAWWASCFYSHRQKRWKKILRK